MENLQWIFDGIGTEIISIILGAIIGGTVGYKIGSKSKQNQKFASNSKQTQNSVNIGGNVLSKKDIKIGSINDEEK